MPKKKYRLNDPFFNEFIFHCIMTAPHDLKNKLPLELLRVTTTPEKAKGFAERASLEKKMEMYSRLGGAVSITFHPPDYLSKEKLHEILDGYLNDPDYRDKQTTEMINANVFVITDREIMAIHSLMAMNCHSETYSLNRDYAIIAAQVTSEKKFNNKLTDIEHIKSVMEDHKLLCKFMLYNLLHQNFADSLAGYNVRELMILIYLFLNRNKYVQMEQVQKFFQNTYSDNIVARTCYRLCESGHINQFTHTWKYTISGTGIQVIAGYVNRILNQTLNY